MENHGKSLKNHTKNGKKGKRVNFRTMDGGVKNVENFQNRPNPLVWTGNTIGSHFGGSEACETHRTKFPVKK